MRGSTQWARHGAHRDRHDGLHDGHVHAHAAIQGVIAGANMVLVDFHPQPSKALVDGPQALHMDELGYFLEDIRIARDAYEQRVALAAQQKKNPASLS